VQAERLHGLGSGGPRPRVGAACQPVVPGMRVVHNARGPLGRHAHGGVAHGGSPVAGWTLFLHDVNDGNTGSPPDKGNGTAAYRGRGAVVRRQSLAVWRHSTATAASGGRMRWWRAPEALGEGGEGEAP
jgi:hypothetical protein